MQRRVFLNFIGVGSIFSLFFEDLTKAKAVSKSIIDLQTKEGILNSAKNQSWTFQIPQKKYRKILLSLEAHLDWERLAGAAYIMEVRVNGISLERMSSLVNKPPIFNYADGRHFNYYGVQDIGMNPQWLVFYSPDYESNNFASSGYQVIEGQATSYVFDITKLIRTNGINQINLANRSEAYRRLLKRNLAIRFRNIKLIMT